jgi:hypothetical protein
MAPIGMAILAWSNLFRPDAARWHAGGELDRIAKAAKRARILAVAAIATYTLVVLVLYIVFRDAIVPPAYRKLDIHIVLWAAFFTFSVIANISTGVLMAAGNYKSTFTAALLGGCVGLPAMYIGGLYFASPGVLCGLVLGELAVAVFLTRQSASIGRCRQEPTAAR